MATGFLSPIGNPSQQFFTDQGVILAGGLIYTYLAGTTTPAATFTTSGLGVANPNPIVLNSSGRPPNEVWLQSGTTYKFVITDSNNNPLSVSTFDNISGINDVNSSTSQSEWVVSALTPTFVSGTQFTLPGNQTSLFSVNRRMYAVVTAGTIYGTITASTFSTNTTVTVSWDSGSLDSGLSQVAYSLLNGTNPSLPANDPVYKGLLNIQLITANGTLTTTKGANRARVRMCGAGGAGGGTPNTTGTFASAGGGGGSGAYLEFWVLSGWQSLNGNTLTIGAAGTGVAGAGGNNGGDTIFGSIATAPGGKGAPVAVTQNTSVVGLWVAYTGSVGGISSPPTCTETVINSITGGYGSYAVLSENGSLNVTAPGVGASTPLGRGGGAGNVPPLNDGEAGQGYGSGGGGAISVNTSTTYPGGNGAPGVIIIEEYM